MGVLKQKDLWIVNLMLGKWICGFWFCTMMTAPLSDSTLPRAESFNRIDSGRNEDSVRVERANIGKIIGIL
ncbi:hypothetical protein K3495_g2030 [Podosphaera aphanis]|nr:hypothetical protein K3495_g2030 [Podosphaera aphanis]